MIWIQPNARRRGLSLIEMLVVVGVLAILASMGYAALYRARSVSKDVVCRSNLKQIAAALDLYYNDHKRYPGGGLPEALAPYVGEASGVFVCPADVDPQGDSYSDFFVARDDQSTQDYVCGCPRHMDKKKAVTLFTSASAQVLEMRPVFWNGEEIPAGTEVGSGVLSFADGSRVTIPSGMVVRLVQSFRLHDGRLYSLVDVGVNETGTLDVEVTPGSRFEVVTPAAIAGVKGTRFQVTVTVEGDVYAVKVDVTEGTVVVQDRWSGEPGEAVKQGESNEVKHNRRKIRNKLWRRWLRRRRRLEDDYVYEADGN